MTKIIYFLLVTSATILLQTKATTALEELTTTGRYYVSEAKLTFIEAMIECKTLGMEMMRIENQSVSVDLMTYLGDARFYHNNSYWIGGLKLNNGAWVWLETQEYFSFTQWGEGEPDDGEPDESDPTKELCAQLGLDYGDDARYNKWQAEECSFTHFYICQRSEVPLSPITTSESSSSPVSSTSSSSNNTTTTIPVTQSVE